MLQNETSNLLELEPLNQEALEKVDLIRKILDKKLNSSVTHERHEAWFNELYEKSLSDLKIYYNVYK